MPEQPICTSELCNMQQEPVLPAAAFLGTRHCVYWCVWVYILGVPCVRSMLSRCLACLQVFILDSLAAYDTTDPRDAEKIVERVLPRLQHVNSAVVLSAIKVSSSNSCTSSSNGRAHEPGPAVLYSSSSGQQGVQDTWSGSRQQDATGSSTAGQR